MNAESAALEAATIRQQCKVLRLPSIAAQCAQLAEQAVRERRIHLGYLEALRQTELEDREQRLIGRRIREARLPRMKSPRGIPTSRATAGSRLSRSMNWPRATTSPKPNRSFWSATAAPAKPICSPDSWWRPAGRSGGCDLPPPRH